MCDITRPPLFLFFFLVGYEEEDNEWWDERSAWWGWLIYYYTTYTIYMYPLWTLNEWMDGWLDGDGMGMGQREEGSFCEREALREGSVAMWCDAMRWEVRGERLLLIIKRYSEGIGFTCVTPPLSAFFLFFFVLEYTQKDNACERYSVATCTY